MEEFIPIFFFMCVAGVLILRPVSKKLGILIEAFAKERLAALTPPPHRSGDSMERVANALDQLSSRLDRLDDRILFVERLVEERPRQRLTG